jgi:hypothetical protein
MNAIIAEFVDYVENRTTGNTLASVQGKIEATDLRILAIKLLGWLKEMARTGKHRPLAFNNTYTWCHNLLTLLSNIPQLNDLLVVDGNHIDFRDTLPADERVEIARYVDDHYKPKLRT